jgi:hypothetical protein
MATQQPSAIRRVDALIALTDRYLPTLVDSDGSYSDWNVAAPAFVALSMNALEAVFQLPPPRHRISAEAVTRSLADYGITFAWLAGPTDEAERADRMLRFERDEWASRRQADKRYTTILPERAELYKDLIARGKMPAALLGDAARARIAEIEAAEGPKGMPPILDRAIQADEVWTKEIPALREQPLANLYAALYTSLSFTAHASVSAVDRFVVGQPPRVMVGYAEPIGDEEGPYDIACSVATVVLVIATLRLGWPPLEDVYAAGGLGKPPPSGVIDFQRTMRTPENAAEHDAPGPGHPEQPETPPQERDSDEDRS